MSDRPTCVSCPYWSESLAEGETPAPPDVSPGDRIGLCRRHAPRAAMDRVLKEEDFSDLPTWPETLGSEWCGEHPGFPGWLRRLAEAPLRRLAVRSRRKGQR